MVTTLGTRIVMNTKYIPTEMLTESVIGSTYALSIETKGVENPEEALNVIKEKLREEYNIEMYYGEVSDNMITIQIEGSPFVWFALLAFLPQILAVIGVAVALISVYLLVSSVPTWVYALGGIAIVLLVAVPKILPSIIPAGAKK